jgi:hypothetical protein
MGVCSTGGRPEGREDTHAMAANAGRGSHACLPGLARWLLLALALAPAAAQGQGAQLVPLAMSGASPPGGNGTFQLFGIPTINASGQVAFGVSLADTQPPDPEARGVYLADGQTLAELVRVGDPAPDGNGTFLFFSSHGEERFALNADGTVAFRGELEGTAASLPNFDDSGLFLASAADGVTQLVRLQASPFQGRDVDGQLVTIAESSSLLTREVDSAFDLNQWFARLTIRRKLGEHAAASLNLRYNKQDEDGELNAIASQQRFLATLRFEFFLEPLRF